jgi:hypothetical protein
MSARVRIVGLLVVNLGLALWASTAVAGVIGTDGGNTVTVGAATSSSSSSDPAGGAATETDGGSSEGVSPAPCTYSPVELSESAGFDLAPGGPTPGEWYLVQCPGTAERAEWIPTGPVAPAPAAAVAASPAAAAARAAASIVLPSPPLEINPAPFSIVNFATWLAVAPGMWHPYRATATVGGITATAVATPVSVVWTMGDGGVVVCDGPGTVFNPALPLGQQTTSCSYTYQRSSYGEPSGDGDPNDGAFPVTATVTWRVTWTAVGAPGGGSLPSLHTSSTVAVRVEQVESVGVGS